jgi:SAM-dependent methyltransferase
MQGIDFGRTAGDYARHRAGFPARFFQRLAREGLLVRGERALDLGTGTGTVARVLARAGLRVVGLDPAPAMLREARRLAGEEGLGAAWVQARAEASGLAAGSFELVCAGQCWHWFDRPAAAREVLRLLAPGGRLVIAHYDWLVLPGNLLEATEALIRAHNPAWVGADGTGFYPRWAADLTLAGFEQLESFTFDEPAVYSHEAWRGRIRASAGVAASLPPERVQAFDRELAALLRERFPADPQLVPHRVFALAGRRPA